MRHYFFALFIVVMIYGCKSQAPANTSVTDGPIYEFSEVDTEPEPEGGFESLYKEWNSNVEYTREAIDKSIEGKVFVGFIVNTDGQISSSKVEQGLGHGLDEAALNGLENTKLKWKAGMKDGEEVRVKMVMPFVFKLN